MISTNFPLFCARQLKKGNLILKEGKGIKANYQIQKTEPKEVSKELFSTRKNEIAEDLPGEIWKTTFCSSLHEVSNLGRIRNKKTKCLISGTLNPDGYLTTVLKDNKKIRIHRLVLQTFNPVSNFENLIVDHINGVRTDNKLENLRWGTTEQNTLFMLKNREEITKETTRLINKYGYEKTLKLISAIQ